MNADTEFNEDGPEDLDLTATDDTPEAEDRGDNLPEEVSEAVDEVKPSGARIPKARLDEVISQRETLKEQLAEANRKLQEATATKDAPPAESVPAAPTTTANLKDLRAQHREAMMDGDMDKAATLDELIDVEVIRIAEARFEQKQATQFQQTSLQAASAQALSDFPYLDTPDGAEALDLIVMSRDRKIAAGMAPARALIEAVSSIAPRFLPSGQANSDKGLSDTTASKDTRSANALLRGAADSNQQPPSIQAGVGNRATATRVDVAKLSEEQFENLPDAEKKRLRGD